jgi:hypothetical protein
VTRGVRLVRGVRRSLSEDEQHKIEGAIVETLESHSWEIRAGANQRGAWAAFDAESKPTRSLPFRFDL